MYKLLLATNDPKVLSAYAAIKDWSFYGFRDPRIVPDSTAARESLQKHHADGIAICLPDDQQKELNDWLTEQYPLLPILPARHHEDNVRSDTNDLSRFLGSIYADNSDERYDLAENMRRIRHAYFRTLLSGKVNSTDAMERRLSMLRSRMDLTRPCLLVRFALPDDDSYLAGHWHYGNDRLETALRNIFGAELNGMRLLESVLDNGRIYLLACPMRGSVQRDEDASITEVVSTHARAAIEHVREYLSIDMQIETVTVLPRVTALADADFRKSIGI